jgi:two-component system, OmpR family, response regulator
MNILVIEDDARISDFIVKGLEENGYAVSLSTSGEAAREMISESSWDLILMDIMLPGINGVQLTKLIRHKSIYTPILVLSALGEPADKITALDSGADDYITKPFHFQELISRINALTRRTKFNFQNKDRIYQCGELQVNLEDHSVKYKNTIIELSSREFRLLTFLLENKNKVLTRTQILTAVWGINFHTSTNVVDVYISYLRNKLNIAHSESLIHTVKGVGYILKE